MTRPAPALAAFTVLAAFTLACGGLVPPITPWTVDHPGHVKAGATFTATVQVMSHIAQYEESGDEQFGDLDGLPGLCVGLPAEAWEALEVSWSAIDADGQVTTGAAVRDPVIEQMIVERTEEVESEGLADFGLIVLPSDLSWSCWRDRPTPEPPEDDADPIEPDPTEDPIAWDHLTYEARIRVADDAEGTHDIVWAGYVGELALPMLSLLRVDEPADAFDHFEGVRPPHQPAITSITWGAGTFVGVTYDGRAGTTDDGETWVFGEPITDRLSLQQVEYGHGRFVAIGQLVASEPVESEDSGAPVPDEPTGAVLAWSDDAVDWSWELIENTAFTCLRPGVSLWLVCAEGAFGRFDPDDPDALGIADELMGDEGPLFFPGDLGDVHEHADGTILAWEAQPLETTVDDDTPPTQYHRYDPVEQTWTSSPTPVAGAVRVAWAKDRYVAVGVENLDEEVEPVEIQGTEIVLVHSRAAVSTDGISWELHEMEDGTAMTPTILPRVAHTFHEDGQFVSVERYATVQVSADGETWRRHLVGGLLYLQDLARSDDGVWLVLGIFGDVHRAVERDAPAFPDAPPPTAHEGIAYTHPLGVTDGAPPLHFVLQGGSLPDGVTLDEGGLLAGTPSQSGAFAFTAGVEDAWGRAADAEYTLAVSAVPTVATTTLPAGMVGDPYAVTLEAAGGAPPLVWSTQGALPDGLAIAGAEIAGTPSAADEREVVVVVTDDVGRSASRALTLTIAGPPTPPDPPSVDERSGACGCASAPGGGGPHALWIGLIAAAIGLRRRRRDGVG